MKKSKKSQYKTVIVLIVVTILISVVSFFYITNDQEYWNLQQRIDGFCCKMTGGEYLTMGPVGCCADEDYYKQFAEACESTGGYYQDITKNCVCPKDMELVCPMGNPCGTCICR